MGDCNRCGKCCFIPTGEKDEQGKLIMRKCAWLIPLGGGKYGCRVYNNRLGRKIGELNGHVFRCKMYNSLKQEIDGCPMNIGGKQLLEVTINKGGKTASLGVKHETENINRSDLGE